MQDKELRKLKRVELLELLVEQATEIEKLRQELEEAQQALERRELMVSQCGSLAEAALKINEVFAAADRAARDYLNNVRAMGQQQTRRNLPEEDEL